MMRESSSRIRVLGIDAWISIDLLEDEKLEQWSAEAGIAPPDSVDLSHGKVEGHVTKRGR